MIRNFILGIFSKFLDIIVVLSLILVLVYAFIAAEFTGIIGFLLTLLGGIVTVSILFGFIYIILDIRELLKENLQLSRAKANKDEAGE